jgi:hypothetical protein
LSGDVVVVLKEGWLTKQGGRYKSWKRRYIVLKESRMLYFKDTKKKVLAQYNEYHFYRRSKTLHELSDLPTMTNYWLF